MSRILITGGSGFIGTNLIQFLSKIDRYEIMFLDFCGCPIITTTNVGVEKGHFPAVYIPARDVNAIVNAVESIFSSPQLQENFSSSVFDFANKEYSPEQYEKNLIYFFKSC